MQFSDLYYEILDELNEDLMRCGIEDFEKVDELADEYLERARAEIDDAMETYYLRHSIRHAISDWRLST